MLASVGVRVAVWALERVESLLGGWQTDRPNRLEGRGGTHTRRGEAVYKQAAEPEPLLGLELSTCKGAL